MQSQLDNVDRGSVPRLTQNAKWKLFAGLDATALQRVVCESQSRRIAPKTDVAISGMHPDNLYLLQGGRAQSYILTESGVEVALLWAVPGDVIGLVSLLSNPPTYMANTTTVTECEFLVWDHSTIRRLAKAYPKIIENGFRMALQYLGGYMKRHSSVMTKSAEARLAQVLLQLANEAGEVKSSGIVVDITNERLSSLSDISSFTASRLLSKWERDGKISKERGRVTLRAPEALIVV
jgi:CRP/FNR family transcriptional regulator, nitrogen oxide reductase regulator